MKRIYILYKERKRGLFSLNDIMIAAENRLEAAGFKVINCSTVQNAKASVLALL